MKTLFLLLLLMPIFTVFCYSQNNSEYTYKDLINQQKIERDELKQTQETELKLILEHQKTELSGISRITSSYDYNNIRDKHDSERYNLTKMHIEERERQKEIQAEERIKLFPTQK